MAFAVLHASKVKGNLGGLGCHIDRTKIPKNAVAEKTPDNLELCKINSTLHQDVQARIKEGYTGKTAIRKDAVTGISLVLSGSHDRMKELETDRGQLLEWAKDNYDYIKETFGEENMVRCTLHLDEKTPHIHAVVVPITPEGRLTAKYWLDGKKKLKKMQSDYARHMEKWGLKRGVENANRKHITTKQFYKYLNANDIDAKKLLANEYAPDLVSKMLQELQGEKQLENIQELTKSQQRNYYHEREISERPEQREKGKKQDRGPSLSH